MNFADETLMAYVDGELDAGERAAVDGAMARDPEIRSRIDRYRLQREQLRAAYDKVLVEPVPGRLVATAQGIRSIQPARRWAGAQWAAIAASLFLGAALGWGVLRETSETLITADANGLVARGALAQTLSDDLAGMTAGRSVEIGLSFRDKSGDYCRTFRLAATDPVAGVACRSPNNWQVKLLTRDVTGTPVAAYRQAGSELPADVLRTVERLISGDPFDVAEESAARERGWRSDHR